MPTVSESPLHPDAESAFESTGAVWVTSGFPAREETP